MSEEWTEAVWVAISLILLSTILLLSINLNYTGKNIMSIINQQEASTELLKEFRKYNAFDNKTVYCQDVVSIVLETRGEPYVKVAISSTVTKYWQTSSAVAKSMGVPLRSDSAYNSTAILDQLNINKTYKATLVKGSNGEVVGIHFVAN